MTDDTISIGCGGCRVKYLLCPGHVQSKTDSQYHYIGARELARLYGVSMYECEVRPERMSSRLGWRPPEGAIELHPRWDGNYVLPNSTAETRQPAPPKTLAQLAQTLTAGMPLQKKKKNLPPGTCEACDGEGEQGGQFCGGYWTCETCGGTGKVPNTEAKGPRSGPA